MCKLIDEIGAGVFIEESLVKNVLRDRCLYEIAVENLLTIKDIQ